MTRFGDPRQRNVGADALLRLRAGERCAFEPIIRKHNQRLFRIARAILRDDAEAEDVVQEVYIKAFTRLDDFDDIQGLSPWLSRVTANQAIDRLRKTKRAAHLINDFYELLGGGSETSSTQIARNAVTPERQAAMSQIRTLLEREIDKLPDGFREVFVLRVIEEMSVEETSDVLQIPAATVKSRLHRARTKLQQSIKTQFTAESLNAFPFAGVRCDRITAHVLDHLEVKGVISPAENKPPD